MIPNFSIVYLDTQQLDNIFTEEKVVAVRVDEKNTNARLYDPVIGRFFSPDPFVQTPDCYKQLIYYYHKIKKYKTVAH